MANDRNERRAVAGFPVHQPLEALRADHTLVRELFDQYLNAQDIAVKRETGPRVLLLLEMHAALEEGVFYPRVQEAAPGLVAHCEEDHQEARELIERLKGMEEGDPLYERAFQQLAAAVLGHIEREEADLFPQVQQAQLDLHAIGLQMQAFEANILSPAARRSGERSMLQ